MDPSRTSGKLRAPPCYLAFLMALSSASTATNPLALRYSGSPNCLPRPDLSRFPRLGPQVPSASVLTPNLFFSSPQWLALPVPSLHRTGPATSRPHPPAGHTHPPQAPPPRPLHPAPPRCPRTAFTHSWNGPSKTPTMSLLTDPPWLPSALKVKFRLPNMSLMDSHKLVPMSIWFISDTLHSHPQTNK